eukprot:1719758-Amphidinium_carterae.1
MLRKQSVTRTLKRCMAQQEPEPEAFPAASVATQTEELPVAFTLYVRHVRLHHPIRDDLLPAAVRTYWSEQQRHGSPQRCRIYYWPVYGASKSTALLEKAGEDELGEEKWYCQALVVALRWAGARLLSLPSEAVLAVPAEAATEYADALQCGVALLVLPGSTLWERLVAGGEEAFHSTELPDAYDPRQ